MPQTALRRQGPEGERSKGRPIKLQVLVDNGAINTNPITNLREGLQKFFKKLPEGVEASLYTTGAWTGLAWLTCSTGPGRERPQHALPSRPDSSSHRTQG